MLAAICEREKIVVRNTFKMNTTNVKVWTKSFSDHLILLLIKSDSKDLKIVKFYFK